MNSPELEPWQEATVGTKALRAALAAAEAVGLDGAALAAEVGLRPETFDDPDARTPHDAWVALFAAIEEKTRDPGIGLRLAALLPMGHFDTIDFMISASATLGDALGRIERYFGVVSTAVAHTTSVVGAEVHVRRAHVRGASRSRAATELVLATIVVRLRAGLAGPWSPKRVLFAHARAAPLADYRRAFGCEVVFDAAVDTLVVPVDDLSLAMREPAAELCRLLERHVELLAERATSHSPTVGDRVRRVLVTSLRDGPPTLAEVAKRLGIGARTLQRRLVDEGTPYRDLLERTREALSVRYLEDRELAAFEVAYLVGFSDTSAFHKAFRRWTGESPGAYRARRFLSSSVARVR